MKLQELAVANPTKQAAKVFESYFGNTVKFDQVSPSQARGMLQRVRTLISEHRRTPEFHRSEQNPTYLKLVVIEQALSARMQQKESPTTPVRASLKTRLQEASEVQQAQVVLAAQDMVDQVQGMSEDISAMQFKDLPALVDQIKNEVGTDQAMQFNTDATAALTGLLQNLQGAKTQLEAALGVVTGQAPVVPGADMAADLGAEMPAELPAAGEEEIDVTDVDLEEPADTGLGRERR